MGHVITPRLGLTVPDRAEDFDTDVLAANWNLLEGSPGVYICTSTTRPSWGAGQIGRTIRETNTGLEWAWTSGGWARTTGSGLLKTVSGGNAIEVIAAPFSTTTTGFKRAITVANVVIPDGQRPLGFIVDLYRLNTEVGHTSTLSVFTGNTDGVGSQLGTWLIGTAGEDGGGPFIGYRASGLSAGTYTFSLQVHSDIAGHTTSIGGQAKFGVLEL